MTFRITTVRLVNELGTNKVKLPVGLLAQLVERCTGIAEVMGSNPYGPEIFSGPTYNY